MVGEVKPFILFDNEILRFAQNDKSYSVTLNEAKGLIILLPLMFITHSDSPKKDLDKKITIAITLSTPLQLHLHLVIELLILLKR